MHSGRRLHSPGDLHLICFILYESGQTILAALADGPTDATLLPQPLPPSAALNTGVVHTSIFGNGFIGADPSFGFGEGFVFDGEQGLFVGTILVGIDGNVTTNPYNGISEFDTLRAVAPLTSPFPAPFEGFDQGVEARFSAPLGVTITERAYARDGDAFIVFDLAVENTTAADLGGLYVGLFADWDAGASSTDDAGGFDETLRLAYVFDPAMDAPYFGVAALGTAPLSGWSVGIETADDAELFTALTTEGTASEDPAERATVTGLGPFDLTPGETETVRFAMVAGEDEADLFANARQAQDAVAVGVEVATPTGRVMLEPPYPNPLAAQATIGFALPAAQAVRLAVYDVLGREVARLADGVRPAGEQAVVLEASGLPSGVYVVRLEAGGAELTQRLTVVR